MRAQYQILNNLKLNENKEDWYYACNEAEQALFKVKNMCKDEAAIKALERIILDLNNIRMEQYEALNEYALVENNKDLDQIADELIKLCWKNGKTHDIHTEIVGLLDNIKYDTREFPELDFVRQYNLTDEDYNELYKILTSKVSHLIKESYSQVDLEGGIKSEISRTN